MQKGIGIFLIVSPPHGILPREYMEGVHCSLQKAAKILFLDQAVTGGQPGSPQKTEDPSSYVPVVVIQPAFPAPCELAVQAQKRASGGDHRGKKAAGFPRIRRRCRQHRETKRAAAVTAVAAGAGTARGIILHCGWRHDPLRAAAGLNPRVRLVRSAHRPTADERCSTRNNPGPGRQVEHCSKG